MTTVSLEVVGERPVRDRELRGERQASSRLRSDAVDVVVETVLVSYWIWL
ncbi:hypothetical protein ACXET9_01750 [Brachybacterium sp. DNPG3]